MIGLIVLVVGLLVLFSLLIGAGWNERINEQRDRRQAAAQQRINMEWKLLREVREQNDDPDEP